MPHLFFLAAGGTGGHLFPAYALAQELNRRGHTVDLVTDDRGDRYGSDFPARQTHRIPAATFRGVSLASIKGALKLLRGVHASRKLIAREKPAAVIGFGGYPTFPPLVAARMRGLPRAIHEANAVMGRANRALAPHVTAVATSFANTGLLGKTDPSRVRVTGNPVRDNVRSLAKRPYVSSAADQSFQLVVFGGSQGARYFSDTVPPAVARLAPELRSRLSITQQCREEDMSRVSAAYQAQGVTAHLGTFFKDLPQRMSDAQLVIARAGASSVTELAVLGRPSLLVPLPHALDNDQLRNASALAAAGGAWCLEQAQLDAEVLAAHLHKAMTSPRNLAMAAAAAAGEGRADAVERLADLAERLASGADG
ncbi:MAG: undecaprenyldiphospho-muramoylpentapeptide beta-N-acetylglucosaminyltransferase [Pseudomonadota bacterium]